MDNTVSAIFCTLPKLELRRRRAYIRGSLSPHIVTSSRAKGITELDFSKSAVTRVQLERLIKLEQACCPYFTFEIREMENEFTLIVSGPEGSEDFVRDLFSPEEAASCVCSG